MSLYEKSEEALADWREIIEYTFERFGVTQAEKYALSLIECIEAMAEGKGHYRDVEVSGRLVRVKHCQKHYIFGLILENSPILIIAFFHERMDLMRRLANRLN